MAGSGDCGDAKAGVIDRYRRPCRSRCGTAQALAVEFGLEDAICGSDLDQVIASTEANTVFDIVVPVARAGVVRTALGRGCNVLSEKPLATSLAEAKELIGAAKAAKYMPSFRTAVTSRASVAYAALSSRG